MTVSLAVYEIFTVNGWHDLETGGRGGSKSLKMAPFDRSHTTSYWSAIVNIALSCTALSYLTLNNIVTLKSGLEVIQTGTVQKLGAVSYLPSIATISVSLTVYEIFSDQFVRYSVSKYSMTLKTRLEVVQGH